jgi:hypothetical protein
VSQRTILEVYATISITPEMCDDFQTHQENIRSAVQGVLEDCGYDVEGCYSDVELA